MIFANGAPSATQRWVQSMCLGNHDQTAAVPVRRKVWICLSGALWGALFAPLFAFAQVPDGSRSPRPEALAPQSKERQTLILRHQGRDWRCTLQGPRSNSAERPLPLVLVLHGSGGDGASMLERSGWGRKASEAGFLAVAPDAQPLHPGRPTNFLLNPRVWNSGFFDPSAPRSQINDTQFIEYLLDELGRRYAVDPSRVYATGHSNGGGMVFRLGVELSDRLAAVAPVASVCWVDPPPLRRPIPTLLIVGTSDPLVPILGGQSVLPWGKRTTPPLGETMAKWALALGCPAGPIVHQKQNGLQTLVYKAGPEPRFTVLLVEGQGHNWPGGRRIAPVVLGPDHRGFDATETIWNFFRRHQLSDPRQPSQTPDGRRLEEPVLYVR
jgi:polyhydroxybutyrate depolymerase